MPSPVGSPINAGAPTRTSASRRLAIAPVLVLLLLVNLATGSLFQLPLTRLVEQSLCREYYGTRDPSIDPSKGISEELCKVDEVQKGLAWIIGVMETCWILGDFIMTIPLGFLAEKYGRKAILWLNLTPRIFMLSWTIVVGFFGLSPKALVVGPILSVLGGDCVFNSMTYYLASSLTDDYVLRATYFSWMSSVSYVVSFCGPALAGFLMTAKLLLPFWIGAVLLILAVPTILMLPNPAALTLLNEDDEQRQPLVSSPTLKARNARASLMAPILERIRTLISTVRSRNLAFLLVSFFLTSLASSDTKLLAQYISKRYHWTFASAGYLLSAKAIVNFILLTVIVPGVVTSRRTVDHLQSRALSDRANIRYAHICLAVSVLGALAIALAATIPFLVGSLMLYALGSALPVFTLGLLKSPSVSPREVDEQDDDQTHIFSIVMMVKTLGSLVGAPLMAALWVHGIQTSTLGVPYFVSAALYSATIGVFQGISR
ncbi:major facilitator superfamily domain-containing protein [Biscogniauxia mediterranea]|nr:major facilitator superfamily domain-containing protein [Biscogniauxia mediterranea]